MEFEKEIKELDNKIVELKKFSEEQNVDFSAQIHELENKLKEKMLEVSEKGLTPWQRTQISRNPKRPYTLDYAELITDDFIELHGDRLSKDDPAIIGALAKIDDRKIMIIGHQKGRDVESNIYRNFGMSGPEGYRKALRLMKLAERFNIPIVTFIDTAGAYPGIEAEEKGQGEAIARNLMEMSGIRVPIITIVIGEGGSGGALGIGVADRVFILENSIYSVISPEGCASILFKDASKAEEAANDLKLDAINLKKLGVVDDIIPEVLGGAHRDYEKSAEEVKKFILRTLDELNQIDTEELLNNRYEKFRIMGDYYE